MTRVPARALHLALLVLLAIALAACGAAAPAPTATPVPPTATPVPPTATPVPAPDLSGLPAGVWQMVRIEYPSGKVLTIEQPQNYTVQFVGNGRVQIMADCNGGNGTVAAAEQKLTFGALVTTKMACPPGSHDQVFLSGLQNAAAYVLNGDEFIISQAFDGGEMVFRRAP